MHRLLVRGTVLLAVFAAPAGLRLSSPLPILPNPLAVDLVLEPGGEGRADPLIVSGRTNTGDFLGIRFSGENTFAFYYDSWGFPGIPSKIITYRSNEKLRLS